jgi:eukaryotic-like serine/threonine-protein kinase
VSSPSPAFGRWGHEFETLLELGQGGMATAYLARMLGPDHFQRLVVLKRLSLELSANSDAVSRFMAEARVGAQLHHSNVVGTHRIDRDAAGPFIVLEYVEGGSVDELLSASLARGRALPFRAVLRIGLDALAGLRAVHEATASNGRPLEILHRDVSMQNVLVGVHDGVARLSDFGVAKSRLSATRTEPGCLVGKILYMAPECLRYQPLGPTVDLYALGLTLWLALAGSDPWPDEDDVELARMIVHDGVPPLPARAGAPPEIVTIIARACALRAADRFQSAREMTLSLEPFRTAGLVASHEEVAALVSELLGDTLRSRRELLANLAPELGVSSLAVNHGALAPTVPARHFEPSPSPRAATAPHTRVALRLGLVFVAALLVALVMARDRASFGNAVPTTSALSTESDLERLPAAVVPPAVSPRAPLTEPQLGKIVVPEALPAADPPQPPTTPSAMDTSSRSQQVLTTAPAGTSPHALAASARALSRNASAPSPVLPRQASAPSAAGARGIQRNNPYR